MARVPIEIGLGANPIGDTLDQQLDELGRLLDLVEQVNADGQPSAQA